MPEDKFPYPPDPAIDHFLEGKPEHTLHLFHALLLAFGKLGPLHLEAAKTLIGIGNGRQKIAWITQLGKNFVHVVFPFPVAYPNNLCFQKIAQVPGQQQYNHHLRIYAAEDINEEVLSFMAKAYTS
jgi:hypothetical protein